MMKEEETGQSHSENGIDILHGPLLKKIFLFALPIVCVCVIADCKIGIVLILKDMVK